MFAIVPYKRDEFAFSNPSTMSSDLTCYFKINRPSNIETRPRAISTDLSAVKCDGEWYGFYSSSSSLPLSYTTSMSLFSKRVAVAIGEIKKTISTHGFSSLHELLFFRGNAELVAEVFF